jgi:hypothetical protein
MSPNQDTMVPRTTYNISLRISMYMRTYFARFTECSLILLECGKTGDTCGEESADRGALFLTGVTPESTASPSLSPSPTRQTPFSFALLFTTSPFSNNAKSFGLVGTLAEESKAFSAEDVRRIGIRNIWGEEVILRFVESRRFLDGLLFFDFWCCWWGLLAKTSWVSFVTVDTLLPTRVRILYTSKVAARPLICSWCGHWCRFSAHSRIDAVRAVGTVELALTSRLDQTPWSLEAWRSGGSG